MRRGRWCRQPCGARGVLRTTVWVPADTWCDRFLTDHRSPGRQLERAAPDPGRDAPTAAVTGRSVLDGRTTRRPRTGHRWTPVDNPRPAVQPAPLGRL